MNKTVMTRLAYVLLVVVYIALTAFILYATMGAFFPSLEYVDYLGPAFGILFAIAAGNDISNLKTDFRIQKQRRQHYK